MLQYETYIYKMKVLESHLDTFGHVNNATYLNILEEARWDFITKNGFGLKKIQETNIGPVILEIQIKFSKEMVNRSNILIKSFVKEIKKDLIITIEQAIFLDDQDHEKSSKPLAKATLKVGVMDLLNRKLIPIYDDWKKALGVIEIR